MARGIGRQHATVCFPFMQGGEIGRAIFFSLNANDPLLGHRLIIGQDSPDEQRDLLNRVAIWILKSLKSS
jgi:hypothetical protein